MRKLMIVLLVLAAAGVLAVGVVAVGGALFWLSKGPAPCCRIEMAFRLDKDGAAPTEAEAELVAATLRKALPDAESVRRNADGQLCVVISVQSSKPQLKDSSDAGQKQLDDDIRKSIETHRRLLEDPGSPGLHNVDAGGFPCRLKLVGSRRL